MASEEALADIGGIDAESRVESVDILERRAELHITLPPLPARSPALNPVENLRQFIRETWLGNRIFASYEASLDQSCDAWNKLVNQPWRILSIGLRAWAHEF